MKLDAMMKALKETEKTIKRLDIRPEDIDVVVDTRMNMKYRFYKVKTVTGYTNNKGIACVYLTLGNPVP